MKQLLFNIKGYAVIIVTLAAVYACFFLFARNRGDDITGMVFKKAASNELDEAETGSTTVTSQIRDRLILLARPIFGVGVLFFSFTAFLAATNHGFDDDSLPVVMILGLLFCACVLLALLLIFKIDKPKTEEPSYGP